MSEFNKGSAEYGDINELAVQVCDLARHVIDTDAERWTVDWDTALQPTNDEEETYYRSIAHAQMNKLFELSVTKKYTDLAKKYPPKSIVEALMVTGKMPVINGQASRVEAEYDETDVTYVYTSIDAGAIGKCQAAMVNVRRDSQIKKYLVAIEPRGTVQTHVGIEMIDMLIDGSALDVLPMSQAGHLGTVLSAGIPPEQLDSIIAQIEAASHDVDPALLAEATALLRDLYHQKLAARQFEQSLGGYTDMTVRDFAEMSSQLEKRIQQRGY